VKSVAHALWALGPLTGLFVPLIGRLWGGRASPYGRRRLFVPAGAPACVVGMKCFANGNVVAAAAAAADSAAAAPTAVPAAAPAAAAAAIAAAAATSAAAVTRG